MSQKSVEDRHHGQQLQRAPPGAHRLLKDAPEEIRVPLQGLRIGKLGVAAIPFETFVEIGLNLKNRSPLAQTFAIELANGSYVYLPMPQQHRLGEYETWLGPNFVEYEASPQIVKIILGLFESLMQKDG